MGTNRLMTRKMKKKKVTRKEKKKKVTRKVIKKKRRRRNLPPPQLKEQKRLKPNWMLLTRLTSRLPRATQRIQAPPGPHS